MKKENIGTRALDEYFATSAGSSPQSQNADGVDPEPKSKFKTKKSKTSSDPKDEVNTSSTTDTGNIPDKIVVNPPEKNPNNTRIAEAKAEEERHGVMTFGRFNPPHAGHEKVVKELKKLAKTHKTRANIFVSHSHDPKKNPIDPETKAKLLHDAFSDENTDIHLSDKVEPSLIHAVKKMYDRGHTHLHVVVGGDRTENVKQSIERLNGKPTKGTGETLFHFKSVQVHDVGAREGDISGTAMRSFARKGDEESFKKNLPSKLQSRHKEILNAMKQQIDESKKKAIDIIKRNLVAKDLNVSGLYKPRVEKSKKDFKRIKVKNWNLDKFSEALSAPTPSIQDLAKKHNISVDAAKKLEAQGASIEKEHTKNKKQAKEIARDHIGEKPDYYSKLAKHVESFSESEEKFITDMGSSHDIIQKGKKVGSLPRYGVWAYDKGKGKHQVIDTHDDLESLKKKHGELQVHKLGEDMIQEAVMAFAQRRKRAYAMKRNKVKLARFRKLARHRLAADPVIHRKSLRFAKLALRRRLAGTKGPSYNKLKYGDKISIDQFIDKKTRIVKKASKQMQPRTKQAEVIRVNKVRSRKGARGTYTYFQGRHMLTMGEECIKSLEEKAQQTGFDLDILCEVYQRGLDSHNPDETKLLPEQFAFNRVNSFCSGGRAALLDIDLFEETDYEKVRRLVKSGLVDKKAEQKTLNTWQKTQTIDYKKLPLQDRDSLNDMLQKLKAEVLKDPSIYLKIIGNIRKKARK